MHKNIHTFIGCDSEYKDSNIVIFGVPFDGTTSYRPGTRFASAAIRNESYSIETYSPYSDKDLSDINVFDGGDLELPFGNTVKVLDCIEHFTEGILDDKKLPCMIGGEHLVTLGAVRAVAKRFENLHIIHLDAHTDLRDDYLGEKLSHATVMRRVYEIVGEKHIFQFGIRSGEKSEFEFAKNHTILQKFNLDGLKQIVDYVEEKPVYLSIDLDVIDPSEFPGTGTPEAGGINFTALVEALKDMSGLNIVACDINELSPPNDTSGISTALACKVLRELLLSVG